MTYTITEFLSKYHTQEACLYKVFKMQYKKVNCCPDCGVADARFKPVKDRRSYRCMHCNYQFYPTKGTIFEKSRVPLNKWFYAMYLMVTSRNGVAAAELQRVLGVTYKCAWRMGHKIRELMSSGLDTRTLIGSVEMDETLVGGKEKNKHREKRTKNAQGMSLKAKSAIFAMVERKGQVRALHTSDLKESTIVPIITDNVSKDAHVSTDESRIYGNLSDVGYKHGHVNHGKGQYRSGEAYTNTIESFFSYLKRTLHGSYIAVSKKYLQNYVNECCYRYNKRGLRGLMFMDLLQQVVR